MLPDISLDEGWSVTWWTGRARGFEPPGAGVDGHGKWQRFFDTGNESEASMARKPPFVAAQSINPAARVSSLHGAFGGS